MPVIEVRLSPDGWVAQLVPPEAISEEAVAGGKRWLCMSWENALVRASLLTDDEVADWTVIHQDEEAKTGSPERP